jgi:dCTP diphosphatase
VSDETTTVAELRQAVQAFVTEREWGRYHDAKNLAMSLSIEAAELMEHFQWVRSEEVAAVADSPAQRPEVIEEVADVLCYVLALANAMEIDLSAALRDKMVKNARKYPVERFRGQYFKPGRRPPAD